MNAAGIETSQGLKQAVRRLTKAVGTKEAAHAIRRPVARVQGFGNPNEPNQISALDVLVLEKMAGDPIVTGFMAMPQNVALVPLTGDTLENAPSLDIAIARLGETVSRVFEAYIPIAKSRTLSGTSKSAMQARCLEAMRALSALFTAARKER